MSSKLNSIWHQGELLIQNVVGTADIMKNIGHQYIREFMPEQHREFFESLTMLYIGYNDSYHNIQASVIFGDAGFVTAVSDVELRINTQNTLGDLFDKELQIGDKIGLVGLVFQTKRRNRVNGIITDISQKYFTVKVLQSFGNCPKYIQPKQFTDNPHYKNFHYQTRKKLNSADISMILNADTFFIASTFDDGKNINNRGADMSHRGGEQGFITINEENELLVDDYFGNGFFNTMGNLIENPIANLLFCDWHTGTVLKITASTIILWNGEVYEKEKLVTLKTSDTQPEAKRTLCFSPLHIACFGNALAYQQK